MPHDLSHAVWRKSSYTGQTGQCVEIAPLTDGVAVRDSKDPSGPVLRFAPAAFRQLLNQARTSGQ